jgi:hypothetical protein
MKQQNRIKAAMRAGRKARGYGLTFPAPWVMDILGKLPDIDLYSIGPNDFAQSLGYPGQPDHPEVAQAMQEITRRIHQAGRRMQADVMKSAGVSDILLEGGRRILEP